MAINVTRLIELGMVPELAKELATQIDAQTGGTVAATDVTVDLEDITATDVSGALQELYDAINA
jgi:hypothetical protein